MSGSIEVIMAAYNNVRDMQLVFEGYLRQTDKSFQLCIADDGSGPEVKTLVDLYSALGLNIRHIWQPDNGFRKTSIVNRAIASSEAEYIIFTDNDCIPSKYYIEDYRHYLCNDKVLIGRRVDMYNGASHLLRSHQVSLDTLEKPVWLLWHAMKHNLKRPEMGIRFPEFVINFWNRKKRGAIGANMAMPRKSLIEVNGYDADFEGYGMEETDLLYRLNAQGYKNQTVLGRCAMYHLYHKEKQQGPEASQMFQKKRKQNLTRCLNGIDQIRENQ